MAKYKRTKKHLTAEDLLFLKIFAKEGKLGEAAEAAYPKVKSPRQKAYRLLEHDFAQKEYEQLKEHAARQVSEGFKNEVRLLLPKLIKQAKGEEPTKRVEETGSNNDGAYEKEQKQYDTLKALSKLTELAGLGLEKDAEESSSKENPVPWLAEEPKEDAS